MAQWERKQLEALRYLKKATMLAMECNGQVNEHPYSTPAGNHFEYLWWIRVKELAAVLKLPIPADDEAIAIDNKNCEYY